VGAVIRRASVLIAVVALLVPSGASAATTTYGRPFANGPSGGDEFNTIERDGATGEMSIVRLYPTPVGGALGCGGSGGWATFEIAHTAVSTIESVAVAYTGALVDPYSFVTVAVYQDGAFVDSKVVRGPVLGDGTVELEPRTAASGDVTIWFGLQMSSACPNIGMAEAVFESVTVTEA